MLYELMVLNFVHAKTVHLKYGDSAIEAERKAMENDLTTNKELAKLYPRLLPLVVTMVERDPRHRPSADFIPSRLAGMKR
jgi:hypothetical protein